jgi:hypothetical protein
MIRWRMRNFATGETDGQNAAFPVDTAQRGIEDLAANRIVNHIRPAQRLDPFPDSFLGIINSTLSDLSN